MNEELLHRPYGAKAPAEVIAVDYVASKPKDKQVAAADKCINGVFKNDAEGAARMVAGLQQLGHLADVLYLDTLTPMQDVLRDNDQVPGMMELVTGGGHWKNEVIEKYAKENNRVAAPIYITKSPDGKLMIHDGHHRCIATYLAGRHFLYSYEYMICEWTYEAYNGIWFDRGYVTPHDPKTEVRLPDFMQFKAKAIQLAKHDEAAARKYILENKNLYARPRQVWTLAELARTYDPKQNAGRKENSANQSVQHVSMARPAHSDALQLERTEGHKVA